MTVCEPKDAKMNLGFTVLILIFLLVLVVEYLLNRKTRRKLWKLRSEAMEERKALLDSFDVSPFDDFSEFDFEHGSFSHVSPFPSKIHGEWRYKIFLSSQEAEDIVTVAHEISECTLGRVIEKLLHLKKPLYLYRKEDNKFWVHGKKQNYLVEHVLVTLGEVDDLTQEKLKQRLSDEDLKAWLNPGK
jgi:hypothetical protein